MAMKSLRSTLPHTLMKSLMWPLKRPRAVVYEDLVAPSPSEFHLHFAFDRALLIEG